jgi:hypothetical protein
MFRIFTVTSLYRFIPRFASLAEALARRPDAMILPLRQRPDPGLGSLAHRSGSQDGGVSW